jgi:hypothetical protein
VSTLVTVVCSWERTVDCVAVTVAPRSLSRAVSCPLRPCMVLAREALLSRSCSAVRTPRVSEVLSRLVRTSVIVSPARLSTRSTSETRAMVRSCSASSLVELSSKAEASTPSTERSVESPAWAARSKVGDRKSATSATRCRVVLAPERGGASSAPHWTTASPPSFVLTMPSVAPAAPEASVTTELGETPSSTVEAARLRGAPTSAGSVRDEPATS